MIVDLIYVADRQEYKEAQDDLRTKYPSAKFEDASDEVHAHRFQVELEAEQDEYFRDLLRMGLATCSLGFNLILQSDFPRIERLLEELKQEPNGL
jgi:hypothetical protein